MKIGHLNVRSIIDKIDEIRLIISKTKLDLLCISETWLHEKINDNMINVPGYTIVRHDRNSNKRGGGVCIYVRSNMSFTCRDDLINDVLEAVWIEIPRTRTDQLIIGCLYRPPNADSNYLQCIFDTLEVTMTEGKDIIIIGDMNYDYKHDECDTDNPITDIEDLFLMTQIVREPTRVTENSSKCLDHILTTIPECHSICGVAKISLSDHYLVYTNLICTEYKSPHHHVRFRDYRSFDPEEFLKDIEKCEILCEEANSEDTVEIEWDKWKDAFLLISDKHAPFKECRLKRRHNPWITSSIIELIYRRDYLKKKHIATQSHEIFLEYRRVRNDITNQIRRNKKEYIKNISLKYRNDSKSLWKELKKIHGNDKHECNIPTDLSNDALNKFFVNVGKTFSQPIQTNIFKWFHPKCIHSFKFQKIDFDKILISLSRLTKDSNVDILNFDSKLLQIAAPIIHRSLCFLFNKSLMTGQVPRDWKIAKVTPIYKGKGSKNDPTNYRPISVVGHVGKILEKEVHNQFLNFLQTNDLISIDQFAFLPNHSTQTCLHRVTDEWYECFNCKEVVAACFLDISKCFDSIDINLLLLKLTFYGVEGCEHEWFTSYLNGRSQAVYCHGSLSPLCDVTVGVPQGSILAPLLFLLFMNDIAQCLRYSRCNIYADDVVIYSSSTNIEEAASRLQSDVNGLSRWYDKNRLRINIDKTKVMLLSPSKNYDLVININKQPIEQVKNIRYLGVIIDDKLQWNIHARQVIKSLSYKIYGLSKMRKFIDQDLLNMLYLSLVQPVSDYSCSVWGHCSCKSIDKLFRLQKRAARVVTGNFDYTHCTGNDIVKRLKWQTFQQRRDYFIATLMFKCIHGLAPTHMINELEMVFERHVYHTRSADSLDVVIPKPNLECFKKSFRYAGAHVWNALPHALQDTQSLEQFKKMYKQCNRK